jgi:hypothetical protein
LRVHQNRLLQIAREAGQTAVYQLKVKEYEPTRRHGTLIALLIETSATLTDEILDLHDRLIGSFFTKSKNKYERAFAEQRNAINDKVRLYARVGAALVAAKDEGRDAFKAIEARPFLRGLLRKRERSRKARTRGGVRSTGAIDQPLFRASALQPDY